jgi:hypothetical protein
MRRRERSRLDEEIGVDRLGLPMHLRPISFGWEISALTLALLFFSIGHPEVEFLCRDELLTWWQEDMVAEGAAASTTSCDTFSPTTFTVVITSYIYTLFDT